MRVNYSVMYNTSYEINLEEMYAWYKEKPRGYKFFDTDGECINSDVCNCYIGEMERANKIDRDDSDEDWDQMDDEYEDYEDKILNKIRRCEKLKKIKEVCYDA